MQFDFATVLVLAVDVEVGVELQVRRHGGGGGDGLAVAVLDKVSVQLLGVAQDLGGHDGGVAAKRLVVGRRGLHRAGYHQADVRP